jgi:hypothetical protein
LDLKTLPSKRVSSPQRVADPRRKERKERIDGEKSILEQKRLSPVLFVIRKTAESVSALKPVGKRSPYSKHIGKITSVGRLRTLFAYFREAVYRDTLQ